MHRRRSAGWDINVDKPERTELFAVAHKGDLVGFAHDQTRCIEPLTEAGRILSHQLADILHRSFRSVPIGGFAGQ